MKFIIAFIIMSISANNKGTPKVKPITLDFLFNNSIINIAVDINSIFGKAEYEVQLLFLL